MSSQLENKAPRGLLLVFEGIDGAGKSLQAELLAQALESRGLPVILSQEPTDGPIGKKIRALFESGREEITREQEYQLFVDDRRDHVKNRLLPALSAGTSVVLDRYYFSTMAYQGALGLDVKKIQADNEAFAPVPDAVFLVEVPPEEGVRRIRQSRGETPNLFEKQSYLEKVAGLFARMDFPYFHRIDGMASPETIHARVMELARVFWKGR